MSPTAHKALTALGHSANSSSAVDINVAGIPEDRVDELAEYLIAAAG